MSTITKMGLRLSVVGSRNNSLEFVKSFIFKISVNLFDDCNRFIFNLPPAGARVGI